jgi:RNA polymerase sigma-70 factor (ECF subfamily)
LPRDGDVARRRALRNSTAGTMKHSAGAEMSIVSEQTNLKDDATDIVRRDIAALLPEARAFARFLVRGQGEADDLLQEAVLRALAASAQFDPATNLKAWLFTILRNLFYEQARRRRRESRALAANFPALEAIGPVQQDRTEVADLQRLLWSLPPLLREALVLVGAQGLNYEEAAVICAVPVGTMKARVSRARTQLARLSVT